jgi:hypothetical protein
MFGALLAITVDAATNASAAARTAVLLGFMSVSSSQLARMSRGGRALSMACGRV